MSAHYGSHDHREPVERLIDATPERFDLTALLEAFRPAWMNEAVCFGHDPDDFFPGTGDRATQAKALCASCPVRQTCLDYALAEGIGHGVWGGLNETERARLRSADRRQPIDHCTVSGYSAHLRRGEAACSDCLGAQRRRSADQRARRMAVAS